MADYILCGSIMDTRLFIADSAVCLHFFRQLIVYITNDLECAAADFSRSFTLDYAD